MALKWIYAVCFLDLLILGLLAPLFRPYFVKLGASDILIGIVESLTSLISFLTGPIAGSLSDSKGRKFMLVSTLLLNLLGFITLGYINNLALFIVGRLIYAFSNKVQIVSKALIADLAPKDKQSDSYAKLGALSAAGFIAGPVIGGYLYQASNNFIYLTNVVVIAHLLSLGFVALIPEKAKKEQSKKDVQILETLKHTFANFKNINWNVFWDIFALKFLAETCYFTFYMTLGITLGNFGASQVSIGYIFALHTVLLMVGSLGINKIKDKFYKDDKNGTRQLLHAFTTLIATFVGFYLSPNYYCYVFFVIPLSLVRSLIDSTQMNALLERTPESEKGVVMGAFESVMPLTGFVFPLASAVTTQFLGQGALPLISIPPAIISVLIVQKMKSNKVKSK